MLKAHWGIKNGLHWILDAAFREDESRLRTSHVSRNLCLLRCMALNLLRQNTAVEAGVAILHRKAGPQSCLHRTSAEPRIILRLPRAAPWANVACRLL